MNHINLCLYVYRRRFLPPMTIGTTYTYSTYKMATNMRIIINPLNNLESWQKSPSSSLSHRTMLPKWRLPNTPVNRPLRPEEEEDARLAILISFCIYAREKYRNKFMYLYKNTTADGPEVNTHKTFGEEV